LDFDIKDFLKAMLVCLLLMVVWQYWMVKKNPVTPPGDSQPTSTAPPSQTPPPKEPAGTTGGEPEQATLVPDADWHVRVYQETEDVVLGRREENENGFRAEIIIDGASGGLGRVLLNDYKLKVYDEQTGYPLLTQCTDQKNIPRNSLQLKRLKITGRAEIFDLSNDCWRVIPVEGTPVNEAVSLAATIVEGDDNPVLEVIRTYRYPPGSRQYNLDFELRLVNKTRRMLTVEWVELYGPMGLVREAPRADRRHIAAAYRVAGGEIEVKRQQLLNLKKKPEKNEVEKTKVGSLLWFGGANKFFTAVLRPLPGETGPVDYIADNQVTGELLRMPTETEGELFQDTQASIAQVTPTDMILAGGEAAFNFQVYLGPISQEIFEQQPYVELGYEQLFFSRSCFCTFTWLTKLLLGLMKTTYAAVHNYGVAIIILVLLVRLILHPITKKSQVNMMKMQKLQPQMEELRKKYGNNKQEMSKRTMELYKDQGMASNFLLGCLPMFLQMPIWIALFTAVDGNVAIRHHGLFPASWHWLTDLAAPDRLIPFAWFGVTKPIEIPFLSGLIGGIDAFNLLPLLLTVAMFLQMKFSPQSQMTQANPQAAQQQKMMMYMMPVMMLLFFYSAPSGLNLYIMASTFGGLIEQKYIRKHIQAIKEKEEEVKVTVTGKVSEKLGPRKRKSKPPKKYFS